MKKKIQIAPSILACNFAKLGAEIKDITKAGADRLHIDVMDGHFVPNLTLGPVVVKSIRKYSSIPFDVHLMITNPLEFIKPFAEAGADTITLHVESQQDIQQGISLIRRYGKSPGLSISPKTSLPKIIPYIPLIDFILIMAVEPGWSGQKFIPETLNRIVEIKNLTKGKKILICVDGGVNLENAPACRVAGADILVSGYFIFHKKPYQKAIDLLKGV